MATEKLEKLTIVQLEKKEKEANKVMIASLIIFLVCVIGLSIIKPDFTGVTIPILAPGIIAFRERKKIIKVLINRIEKQEEEIKKLKDPRESKI
jgi:hypothetical protein